MIIQDIAVIMHGIQELDRCEGGGSPSRLREEKVGNKIELNQNDQMDAKGKQLCCYYATR